MDFSTGQEATVYKDKNGHLMVVRKLDHFSDSTYTRWLIIDMNECLWKRMRSSAGVSVFTLRPEF